MTEQGGTALNSNRGGLDWTLGKKFSQEEWLDSGIGRLDEMLGDMV